jgi:hypothetical protein
MSKVKKSVPRFRVGDWVSFLYGVRRPVAQIIEDRGPLGVKGRRLYGIQFELAPEVTSYIEMPEDLLELAKAPENGISA